MSKKAVSLGCTFLSDHPLADGFTNSQTFTMIRAFALVTGRNVYPASGIIQETLAPE
ncbi:MAG: hypothetical protein HN590_06045 [Calditrichaeota bacterium]|nr:hypothetical protein [Calditrichota bacterium]